MKLALLDFPAERANAEFALEQHDPKNQDWCDDKHPRCAHCHYTRHPCETYELASVVLMLLDELEASE